MNDSIEDRISEVVYILKGLEAEKQSVAEEANSKIAQLEAVAVIYREKLNVLTQEYKASKE